MASPFTVFRKNQTVVMAGLVIVAIIAFVVAPILTQYMNNSYQAGIDGANGQRNLVVRWRGGKIDSGYASALVQTNRNCQALLMRVAEDVIKNGGSPKVPGFRPNGPNQGFELGFTSNNPLDVIRTKLLAERARELGIEFDDSAVDSYIRAFADGRVSNQRFKELMKEQNRLSQFELYRFLKDEFAKEVIMRLAMSGIADGSMPMITPGQSWQLFLRFQQRARIEAFPVLVDDYLSKVTATPSDADLKALYEEGKKRYPNKMFPEPGFQRRYEANIEFVSGNLEAFIDAEKKKLTDEQILAAYNERVAAGRYQVPDKPATTESGAAGTDGAATGSAPAQASEATAPTTSEPTSTDAAPKPPTVESPDSGNPPTPEAGGGTPSSSDQSSLKTSSSLRLVSFQEPAAVQPPAEQPPAEQPATTPSVTEQTPAPANAEASPVDAAASTDTAPASQESSAATTPPPAEGSATPPAESAATAPPAPPAMRTQTLEEVRDQLMRDLVIDKARENMTGALEKLKNLMTSYSHDLRIFENNAKNGQDPGKKPEPLNLKALADEVGLSYGTTGMVNAETIRSLPIGKSRSGQFAFADEIMQDGLELNRPLSAMALDLELGLTSYLGWKIEKKDAYLPTFDEIKQDVEASWRRVEARKLAEKRAQEMVQQLESQTENPWTSVLNETERGLILTPNTFTWMQPAQSFQGAPQLSIVDGLDAAGVEFMRRVFATADGKFNVAPNQSLNVYYVVHVVEKLPSVSELREQFARTPVQFDAKMLGYMENQPVVAAWFEGLEKEMNVEWIVSPDSLDMQQ